MEDKYLYGGIGTLVGTTNIYKEKLIVLHFKSEQLIFNKKCKEKIMY